jgi:poly-gamma-glutamate synthesis protein (capsule biosynthesis protein)
MNHDFCRLPFSLITISGNAPMLKRLSLLLVALSLLGLSGAVTVRGQAAQPDLADLALYPVLFRRPDAPRNPGNAGDAAQVLVVGDVSLARGVAQAADRQGPDYPLASAAPRLQAADLAVGNYEGVIAAEGVGQERSGGYRLRAQPAAAAALARAGFGLVSLANNHSLDWGAAGLQATLDQLRQAGIKTVGAGESATSAGQPQITTLRGVRVVWLSFTLVSDPPDTPDRSDSWSRSWLKPNDTGALAEAVQAARPLGDALIVQFHWGSEYVYCPDAWQVNLAHTAIDAGASLVIGHHPHVLQTFEVYGQGFIAYSLGNFLFDQEQRPGLGLWIRLDKAGLIDVRGLTMDSGLHPAWDDPAAAAARLRNRYPLEGAAVFGYTDGQYGPLTDTAAPTDSTGWCYTGGTARDLGVVDMQGDGDPESVTLRDGVLDIKKDGHTVYTSYPSWQVVDAATGDPNQDGRFEVLMLLWKQDQPGQPVTTHPFILGYRGGEYKVIWGGSATANWLQAVGVADVDGDSLDELVTLERDSSALPGEARYRVAVLGWNGWGFTSRWRSEYGLFGSLAFVSRPGLPVAIAAH